MNVNELRSEIESNFTFVEKPKGAALSFHQDDCDQCRYLREELMEYEGRDLSPQAIRHIYQEMSCLSEKGWRWALPSYLRYCLTDEAQYNRIETEFLIYNLNPAQKYQAETSKRLSALSHDQIQCLIHFLEWCKQNEHWSQYCPDEIASGIAYLSAIRA